MRPKAMVGHSIGEFVCAVLAGVMSLEDALGLVGARGRLMSEMPRGGMLSVRAAARDVAAKLGPETTVASENGPSLCVVAGPHGPLGQVQARLEAEGIACKPLFTSHAFHSPMMDAVVEPFTRYVERVALSAPRTRFVSTKTGTWITPEEARDPAYWGRHLRETVRFADAVATLWKEPGALLLEVGPRATLSTLARQQVTDRARQMAVPSMADSDATEWEALLSAAGTMWAAGVPVDARAFWGSERRRKVPLPTYPFERQRFSIDPAPRAVAAAAPAAVLAPRVVPADDPTIALPQQEIATVNAPAASRTARLADELRRIFEDASGIEIGNGDLDAPFVELGLDSLFLTQVATAVQKKTGVKVTFRQLVEQLPTLNALAEHMDRQLPPDAPSAPSPTPAAARAPAAPGAPAATLPVAAAPTAAPVAVMATPAFTGGSAPTGTVSWVIEQQLQLMAKQLAVLQGGFVVEAPAAVAPSVVTSPATVEAQAPAAVAAVQPVAPAVAAPAAAAKSDLSPEDAEAAKKPFGAIARIALHRDELSPRQKSRLEALTRRYTSRTKTSKQWTQANRSTMADPRVVTGFRPAIKELVYPVVIERSAGSRSGISTETSTSIASTASAATSSAGSRSSSRAPWSTSFGRATRSVRSLPSPANAQGSSATSRGSTAPPSAIPAARPSWAPCASPAP